MTPLHVGTDEEVEPLALAHHARQWAKTTTKIKGDAVEASDLDGYEPVAKVQGLAGTWWRGRGSLIAIYRDEAVGLTAPRCREAHICGGLDAMGSRWRLTLGGFVWISRSLIWAGR
ncbi:hypothetical protein [Streptomyces sp. NPDC048527]|uniref:hypothetical protein n=1 Tax=Streptomyces sp. NPDC048527 TaxID=3365568 RepID=UPI0037208E4D